MNHPPAPATPPGNPFLVEGNWYKAALHVHTTVSDGDTAPAARVAQYRAAGYHIIALTDHRRTHDVSGLGDEACLVLNGMEAHPRTGTGAPEHHLLCLGMPHPFEYDTAAGAQEQMDKILEAGGKVIYAHPYWTDHTLDEMREIRGFFGIEIYNSHCDLAAGKGYNDAHADQAFAKLGLFSLFAVDDVHKSEYLGHGWTMVRAKTLDKDSVMAAIAAGHVYASTGAVITDFRIENGTVRLACLPAAEIRFYFNGANGGRVFTAAAGLPLTETCWNFAGENRRPAWIRAEIIDTNGKHAWTNPCPVS